MEKSKKSLRNKVVIMVGVLFVFIVVGAIYLANKAYALPNNITLTKETEDTDSVIEFTETNNQINFNVTIAEANYKEYFNTIIFEPTYILNSIKDKTITLKLEKSTDNSAFTEVSTKTITNSNLNTNLVYLDKVKQTDSKIYYKLSLYVDNVLQDIKNNNVSGKLDVKTYKNYSFEQIDQSQEWTAEITGDYRVELWGASGNSYGEQQKANSGKGAYTAGTISLNKGDKLYVNVGKNATDGTAWYEASFGGGGAGGGKQTASTDDRNIHYGASGGGATDVRLINGVWSDNESLNSRIMVAAGGGGALYREHDGEYMPGCSGSGGSGGGLIGYQGMISSTQFTNEEIASRYNTGGTQIDGGKHAQCLSDSAYANHLECSTLTFFLGTFGKGGKNYLSNENIYDTSGSGGGGGYWGGTGSSEGITNQVEYKQGLGTGHTSGAGGSSYISGHQGSVAITSSTDRTPKCTVTETNYTPSSTDYQNINETCSNHYSGLKFTDTVMIDGEGYSWSSIRESTPSNHMPDYTSNSATDYLASGNTGSGHARITLLSEQENEGLASSSVWQKSETKHNLTVKYQDEEGNDIATNDLKQVAVGDSYTTSSKTIENYTLKTTPENHSGTMPDENVEVIYIYELNAGADVIVHHYLKDTTTKLVNDETLEGKVTTSYTTNSSETLKEHYTVIEPANKTGVFTNQTQEVTYYYTPKNYTLTVHHYLTGTTTKLADDTTEQKAYNSSYETSSVSGLLEHYTVTTPENSTGTITGNAEVTYYYTPKNYTLTVHHYLTGTTTKLADDVTEQKTYNSSYETSSISGLLEHYTVTTPENSNGTITGNTEVTYYYEPKEYTLTVHHYIKGTTTSISPDETSTKKYNDAYTTNAITDEHYTLVTTPENATGTIIGNTEVTYYYEPKEYTLTVHHYVEGTTTSLSPDETSTKKYDEAYETNAEEYDDYEYVSVEGTPNGKIEGNTVVTYYYKLKEGSKIIVNYKDDKGKVISPSDDYCKGQAVTSDCHAPCKDIKDYTVTTEPPYFDKKITLEVQEVTCIYTINPGEPVDITYTDTDGNEIEETDTVCTGEKIGYDCNTTCKTIEGYITKTIPLDKDYTLTSEKQERQCVYEKRKVGTVIAIYQDEEGNKLTENVNQSGYVDDKYTTDEKKFSGYELIEVPLNKDGIYTEKDITVIYVYKKVNNPFTGDSNIIPLIVVTLGSLSVVGSAIYFFQKRKVTK